MSGYPSSLSPPSRRRGTCRLAACAVVAVALLAPGRSAAQDCPTAQTAKAGFVVERNERQKSDVYRDDQGIVRTVMRYDGKTLLETTLFEGIFQLERIDRGKRIKYEPSGDLKLSFPLKPGQQVHAKFISQSGDDYGRLYVELDVKAIDDLTIGPCKYAVLRIERGESRNAVPPQPSVTELYSPDLKLVLGREYKTLGGQTQLIKYDRIYPIKR